MPADAELAQRLAERTLALVDIPSVSGEEELAATYVRAAVAPGRLSLVHDDDLTLLYATERLPGTPLVLLAGHLDTVPPQGNIPGHLEGGAVHGLGATDMKGGLAVMLEVAHWVETSGAELAADLALLFFPREELPQDESALPALFAASELVREADLVVMLEPTDNTIQAGCLGNLNAELVFSGRSCHSARPWLGENAIDRAVQALARIVPVAPREATIGGLPFVEVLSVTRIEGGIASNVIPDRATAVLNFRYAPDRSPEEAEARLRELVDGAGELRLVGNSPPAHVVAESPLVRRLREAGGFALEPKQAWTPVAEFAAAGLDAVNLGPGSTRFAHAQDEQVSIDELERTFTALARFLAA